MKYDKIVFLALIIVFASCNKKNNYKVTFVSTESKTDGVYSKIISNYCVDKYGIPFDPDTVLKYYDDFQKFIAGGVEVTGRLKVNNEFVEFVPDFNSELLYKNPPTLKIPIATISKVEKETKMLVVKLVVINTINGTLKFQADPKFTWKVWEMETYDTEIINDIEEAIKNK